LARGCVPAIASGETQERGLDLVKPLPVSADPEGDVVVQESLGEADDRVGERARISRWTIRARLDLAFDQRLDARDRSRLHRSAAGGQQS
jgi:hypothetical protein